jgi:hypothetical protein
MKNLRNILLLSLGLMAQLSVVAGQPKDKPTNGSAEQVEELPMYYRLPATLGYGIGSCVWGVAKAVGGILYFVPNLAGESVKGFGQGLCEKDSSVPQALGVLTKGTVCYLGLSYAMRKALKYADLASAVRDEFANGLKSTDSAVIHKQQAALWNKNDLKNQEKEFALDDLAKLKTRNVFYVLHYSGIAKSVEDIVNNKANKTVTDVDVFVDQVNLHKFTNKLARRFAWVVGGGELMQELIKLYVEICLKIRELKPVKP